jgi:hypothetical protein
MIQEEHNDSVAGLREYENSERPSMVHLCFLSIFILSSEGDSACLSVELNLRTYAEVLCD